MSFSLTRKTDYALVALSRLPGESPTAQPISARLIADEYDLPLPLMMNVLKELAGAGLVTSKRGATGGYYLARPASQITFAEVIAAIEGPVKVAMCCGDEDDHAQDEGESCLACRLVERCPITGSMKQFNDLVVSFLRSMTLEELMRDDLRLAMTVQLGHTGERRSIDPLVNDTQPMELNNTVNA